MRNPNRKAIEEGLDEYNEDKAVGSPEENAAILRDIEEAQAALRGEPSINSLFYDMVDDSWIGDDMDFLEEEANEEPAHYRDYECPRCGRTFRAHSAYHLKTCQGP